MSTPSLGSLIAADIAKELPSVYSGGRLTRAVEHALTKHLQAYLDLVRAAERATVAQDILDEADNYAGDMAREFGEIFAKVARAGESA